MEFGPIDNLLLFHGDLNLVFDSILVMLSFEMGVAEMVFLSKINHKLLLHNKTEKYMALLWYGIQTITLILNLKENTKRNTELNDESMISIDLI